MSDPGYSWSRSFVVPANCDSAQPCGGNRQLFGLLRAESKNIPLWNPRADCGGIYAPHRRCQDRNHAFALGFQPITRKTIIMRGAGPRTGWQDGLAGGGKGGMR